jgi:hypothetical protein
MNIVLSFCEDEEINKHPKQDYYGDQQEGPHKADECRRDDAGKPSQAQPEKETVRRNAINPAPNENQDEANLVADPVPFKVAHFWKPRPNCARIIRLGFDKRAIKRKYPLGAGFSAGLALAGGPNLIYVEKPDVSIPVFSNTDSNPYRTHMQDSPLQHWSQLSDVFQIHKLSRGRRLAKLARQIQQRGLCWMALWHQFLSEMRSLLRRIVLQYKRRGDPYILIVDLRRPTDQEGDLLVHMRRRACISDIESFVASRRWATMIDLEIYRDAWAKGEKWSNRNLRTSEPEKLSRESSNGVLAMEPKRMSQTELIHVYERIKAEKDSCEYMMLRASHEHTLLGLRRLIEAHGPSKEYEEWLTCLNVVNLP